ncbi:putative bifunctional diguanylate cyclase/phosphodiesterase [Pseudoalteromonas distincta]|uniref:putative bifunctional diguanylate cyclase/phosphodiesterase n=1 Tax=Pseudoalteromonas distincta TaxID=77608 RepID=UPI00241E5835|nr:bifunctional diguanylate cyclase/phosphodiesterase [Pseudoalteromonas distincta]
MKREPTSSNPSFFNLLYSVYFWFIKNIKSSINTNSSNRDTYKAFKSRQYYAILQQMPFSSTGNMLTSLLLTLFFWNDVNHYVLISWISALWCIAIINIILWYKSKSIEKNTLIKKHAAEWLTVILSLAAILHITMANYLFGLSDEQGRLLIICIIISFASVGAWMFSFLPIAGLAWVGIFTLGLLIGIPYHFWGHYWYFALIVTFFGLILASTVIVFSRMFLSNLEAETKIEHQRQVVGMLLNDFEKNASDWLWETDEKGNLQHTSLHLAKALNVTIQELEGKNFSSIIFSLCKSATSKELFQDLNTKLCTPLPFKNMQIPVEVAKCHKWWAITAKPLVNFNGLFLGWRGVISDITEIKLREQEMEFLANADPLTGLANRHKFNQFIKQVFENKASANCTLFLMDLDNFKIINDSLGHIVGDQLLQEMAKRLSAAIKPNGLVARLGGDEFAIVYQYTLDKTSAQEHAEQILDTLKKPWYVHEYKIEMYASIGIASTPKDTMTAHDLFKFADMALYSAKETGKSKCSFFEQYMEENGKSKLALLSDIKKGLINNEFTIYYQPQVNLKSGSLNGFEALVRWNHPIKGTIAPDTFIPLAEESGLINKLGQFILNQACKDASSWPKHLKVSVNVSALQFTKNTLVEDIFNALKSSNLASEQLEIELTESVMINNYEYVVKVLNNLRERGVKVALDDFGTGYSSLSYLQEIPLDKLKIDRSFVEKLNVVDNTQATAIVKSIISLAQALKFETTIEGIESANQIAIFKGMGSTYGQGYYYSKPIDSASTISLINNWNNKL